MHAGLSITTMVIVTELVVIIIASGFNPQGMMIAGGFVVMIWTIPLIAVMAVLYVLARLLGNIGCILVSLVGFLPAAFIFWGSLQGIQGGFSEYGFIVCFAGLIWTAAWLVVAPWKIVPPRPATSSTSGDV